MYKAKTAMNNKPSQCGFTGEANAAVTLGEDEVSRPIVQADTRDGHKNCASSASSPVGVPLMAYGATKNTKSVLLAPFPVVHPSQW